MSFASLGFRLLGVKVDSTAQVVDAFPNFGE
jgi:hypothetical protein